MKTYSTKTLSRDGVSYTAEFHDLGSEKGYHALVGFWIEAAGQEIDAFKKAPQGWTEEARDGWFCGKFRELSMLADDVYEKGVEIDSRVERRAA
jgi:hypothetical protein